MSAARSRSHIGHEFVEQVKAIGIQQVLSTQRSPWQRAYIEHLVGSIRRECLDHMIVFNERSLKQHFLAYCAYYHRTRTHLALKKDCPEPRAVQMPEAAQLFRSRSLVVSTTGMSVGLPEEKSYRAQAGSHGLSDLPY